MSKTKKFIFKPSTSPSISQTSATLVFSNYLNNIPDLPNTKVLTIFGNIPTQSLNWDNIPNFQTLITEHGYIPENLPNSIKHLYLCYYNHGDINIIPNSIQTLHLKYCNQPISLPNNLKSLNLLPSDDIPDLDIPMFVEDLSIPKIPANTFLPHLTKLKIQDYIDSIPETLKSNLTHVNAKFRGIFPELDNLKELILSCEEYSDSIVFPYCLLEKLWINNLNHKLDIAFPSTLTVLYFYASCAGHTSCPGYCNSYPKYKLPLNLTELGTRTTINGLNSIFRLTELKYLSLEIYLNKAIDLFPKIPEGVEKLELYFFTDKEETSKIIFDSNFPVSLQHLEITCCNNVKMHIMKPFQNVTTFLYKDGKDYIPRDSSMRILNEPEIDFQLTGVQILGWAGRFLCNYYMPRLQVLYTRFVDGRFSRFNVKNLEELYVERGPDADHIKAEGCNSLKILSCNGGWKGMKSEVIIDRSVEEGMKATDMKADVILGADNNFSGYYDRLCFKKLHQYGGLDCGRFDCFKFDYWDWKRDDSKIPMELLE